MFTIYAHNIHSQYTLTKHAHKTHLHACFVCVLCALVLHQCMAIYSLRIYFGSFFQFDICVYYFGQFFQFDLCVYYFGQFFQFDHHHTCKILSMLYFGNILSF
jgi:hypothetical protein